MHPPNAERALDPAAVRDIAPVMFGLLPLGTAVGVALHDAGIAPVPGLATSLLLYGGTGNLAALTLVSAGAGPVAVLLAAVVVNARLLVYGAALEQRFRDQPRWFRWLGPQLIVDQSFAAATARDDLTDPARFRRYWLTAGALITTSWCVAIAAGVVMGPVLPPGTPLDIAAPATLVALLAPRLTNSAGASAGAAAALVAALTAGLPHHAGLFPAVLAGLVAGTQADRGRR